MCRLTVGSRTPFFAELYVTRAHSKASSTEAQGSLDDLHDGFDLLDEVFSSPVAMPGLTAGPPASPVRSPQTPTLDTNPHEAVQRCLFSNDAEKAFGALPRLIVPAAPFSTCYGGSPMQLATPAAVAEPKPQHRVLAGAQEATSVKSWLASMELGLSSSRGSMGFNSPSTGSPTAAAGEQPAGKHAGAAALADLPPPAFALLGLLE